MKRLIVVLAVAVAVLVAVLWWRSRSGSAGGDEVADNRPMPTPKLVQGGGNPNDLPARMPVGARDLPPPPADFNPGQPETPLPNRTEKLRQGEFPLLPPRFDDAAKRAQFRAWWEREYHRRAKVYTANNPGDYPSDEELGAMLDRFYDDGEPPKPGETPEEYDERQQKWFDTWRDLTAAYGTPPKTVISFGGDPQFGQPEPPPVLPEGGEPLQPDLTRPTVSDAPSDTPDFGPARTQ